MDHNNYYYGHPANYAMQSQYYQSCQYYQNYQYQPQVEPRYIPNGGYTTSEAIQQKDLDHSLIRNGTILWAYEPTPDIYGRPANPFFCCRDSGDHACTQPHLNKGGFNHPFLVLDHYQTPGYTQEGDMTLEIVPITSFSGNTILQTYTNTTHPKRLASLPIDHESSPKEVKEAELDLLQRMGKPLLGLENGETGRQLYIEVNHIYRVSVNQLHCYSGKNPAAGYVRLDKESYDYVRSVFGLEYNEYMFNRAMDIYSSIPQRPASLHALPELDFSSSYESEAEEELPVQQHPVVRNSGVPAPSCDKEPKSSGPSKSEKLSSDIAEMENMIRGLSSKKQEMFLSLIKT